MSNFCFLNNRIIPISEAFVSVYDLGLLRGYGIFDYFRTYNGKAFLIDGHLDRFFSSAEKMGLKVPVSRKEIKNIVSDLFRKNKLVDGGVRLVLTGGDSEDCFTPAVHANFFVLTDDLPVYDPKVWTEGVKLMSHEYLRVFPEIKSNNYITAVQLQGERQKVDAFDILYKYRGNMLECTRSNFFGIKGNTLITASENVLAGRTRNLILELAKYNFEIEQRYIAESELSELDEAFVSGTTKKVMPVVLIDELQIGDGLVGPKTKKLMQLFEDYVASC